MKPDIGKKLCTVNAWTADEVVAELLAGDA